MGGKGLTCPKLAERQSDLKPDTLKQVRLTDQGRVLYGNYLSSARVIIVPLRKQS